jgi:hypothetical protein
MRTAAIVVGAIGLAWTGAGLLAGGGLLAGISSLSTIASLGTGISSGVFSAALTGAALTTGLGIVQGVLPEPSQGGSQTKWKADLYAGLPYVMGRTLASGNIVYRRGHGKNNELETFVTVPSIGPIQSIDTTFLNRTTVSFDGTGNAIGTYDTTSGSGSSWAPVLKRRRSCRRAERPRDGRRRTSCPASAPS